MWSRAGRPPRRSSSPGTAPPGCAAPAGRRAGRGSGPRRPGPGRASSASPPRSPHPARDGLAVPVPGDDALGELEGVGGPGRERAGASSSVASRSSASSAPGRQPAAARPAYSGESRSTCQDSQDRPPAEPTTISGTTRTESTGLSSAKANAAKARGERRGRPASGTAVRDVSEASAAVAAIHQRRAAPKRPGPVVVNRVACEPHHPFAETDPCALVAGDQQVRQGRASGDGAGRGDGRQPRCRRPETGGAHDPSSLPAPAGPGRSGRMVGWNLQREPGY